MNLARLIPVCLISSLTGLILPRVFAKPAHLTLAAIAYLLILIAVDRLFGAPPKDINPA